LPKGAESGKVGRNKSNIGKETGIMSGNRIGRRDFMGRMLVGAGAVAGAGAGLGGLVSSCGSGKGYEFTLGSFTRPWGKVPIERALDGMAEAGFPTVGLMVEREPQDALRPTMRQEYLDINKKILSRGMKPAMAMLRPDLSVPPAKAAEMLVPIMDVLVEMEVKYLLDLATWEEDHYDDYYGVMKAYAAEAEKRGQIIGVKPHIGKWETGETLLEAAQEVNSPAYGVCYDPGNILGYSYRRDKVARDTVEELKICIEHVNSFIVKDWKQRERVKGKPSARIHPGEGDAQFPKLFEMLKEVNYKGPCIVELLGGREPEEIDASAVRTYKYLKELTA
jgi:sugar phosphate isomerase/epimerase